MNKEESKGILPHREPMLLVEEAEVTGENTAVGRYHVRGDEWFLQGHFPGNPVVPGVVLCEMMAQSCCVLLAGKISGTATPYFTSLDKVKFRHPVRPGDTLRTECTVTRSRGAFHFASAKGYVGDTLCVSADFSFALVPEEQK